MSTLARRLTVFSLADKTGLEEKHKAIHRQIAEHHWQLHHLHGELGEHEKAAKHRKIAMHHKKLAGEAHASVLTAKFAMKPTPKSKRGMFDGWSLEKLHSALTKAKAEMAKAKEKGKVPKALRSHFSQLTFAIRAKQKGGKKWSKIAAASIINMLANDSHLTINATLLIRLMEWARENAGDDDALHSLVERMMELNETEKHGEEFTMDDAEKLGIAG